MDKLYYIKPVRVRTGLFGSRSLIRQGNDLDEKLETLDTLQLRKSRLDPLFVRAMTWTRTEPTIAIGGPLGLSGLDPLFVRAMTWTVLL